MMGISDKNNTIVYFHRNPVTKMVFYVGIGSKSRAYAFSARNKAWKNYVKKYGIPDVEIVHNSLSLKDAYELEIFYIEKYGRRYVDEYGILVNIAPGGVGGFPGIKKSEEHRKKISEGLKRYSKANPNPNIKEKMKRASSFVKRQALSDSTKQAIRESAIGRKLSDERKKNISLALKGKPNPPVKVINIETGEIYPTISMAAKVLAVDRSNLTAKLSGRIINDTKLTRYGD